MELRNCSQAVGLSVDDAALTVFHEPRDVGAGWCLRRWTCALWPVLVVAENRASPARCRAATARLRVADSVLLMTCLRVAWQVKQIAYQPAMLLETLLNMNTTIAATLHRTSDFRSNLRDGRAQWPGSTRHLHSARLAICIVPPKAEDGRLPGWHHARLPVELRFNGCPGSPSEGRAALAARWMTSPAVVPAGRNELCSLPDPGCQRPGDPHITGGVHGARTSGEETEGAGNAHSAA